MVGMVETSPWRWARVAPLALAASIMAAYSGSLSGVFLFDDFMELEKFSGSAPLLRVIAGSARPLVDLTFRMNLAWMGGHVAGFHLFNLAVHVAASLILFGILRRTLAAGSAGPGNAAFADGLAWWSSLFWGLHPLNTGSVTYIVQRAESLMGLFYLLCLYAVIRGSASRPGLWHAAAVLSCALGMMTKEVMVTAPLAVAAYDAMFLAPSARESLRRRWPLYAGLALTWLLLAAMMWNLRRSQPGAEYYWGEYAAWRYAATQLGVIAHYLKLAFLPTSLCLDYLWPLASSWREIVVPAAPVLALAAATVLGLSRRHPAAYLGLWFFLILAPTSSVIPLPDCAFEHRMYLPLAAVVSGTVVGGHALLRRSVRPQLQIALALTLALTLASLTVRRNAVYGSESSVWEDVVRKRPGNLRARVEWAVALAEAGRKAEARVQFEETLDLVEAQRRRDPVLGSGERRRAALTHTAEHQYFRAQANLGLLMMKEFGDAEAAVRHYAEALRMIPEHEGVRAKLRHALAGMGIPAAEIESEERRWAPRETEASRAAACGE